MTKKNLSDLLKEEATTPPAAAPELEVADETPALAKSTTVKKSARRGPSSRAKSTASRSGTASNQAKSKTAKVAEQSEKAASTATKSTPASSSRSATKADLEKQITQLKADLKAAQTQESSLNKQVKGLQADMTQQQERLFELKDTLEQTQRTAKADSAKLKKVSKELKEAKQVILRMTEAAAAEPAPEPTPAPEPASPPALEAKPALAVKMRPGGSNDIYRGRRLPAYKNVPDYAIDHGEQKNKMLSDEEIGWVD